MNRRLFTASALSLLGAARAYANTSTGLSVAVYDNYAPMSDLINDSYWEGMFIDFARRFTAEIENTELTFSPDLMWNRAMNDIEIGRLDLLFQLSYREERNKFIHFIGSTGGERKYVVLADDNPTTAINTYDDLANIEPPVLINKDAVYNPDFDRKLKEDPAFRAKFNIQEWILTDDDDPYEQIVRLISAQRHGGLIALENDLPLILDLSAKMAKEDKHIVKLRAVEITPFGIPVSYLGVSRKVPQPIRDQIVYNYNQSRKDGSFDLIWSTWQPGRTPPPDIPPGEEPSLKP